MKLVKLSIFALTLGIFATSCGAGAGDKKAGGDSTTTATPPPPPAAPAKMDTQAAPQAKVDSAAKPADAAKPAEKK